MTKKRHRERDKKRKGWGREGHSEGDKEKRQERKLNALKRFEYYVCRVVATYRDSVEGRGTGGSTYEGGEGVVGYRREATELHYKCTARGCCF